MTVYVLVDFVSVPGLAPASPKPFLASSNLLENGESDGLDVSVEIEEKAYPLIQSFIPYSQLSIDGIVRYGFFEILLFALC